MTTIHYPTTRTVEHTDDYHGTVVADPYRWLEEMRTDEVLAWAGEQTALTDSVLRDDERWQKFRERLNTLSRFTKISPPLRAGGKLFYSKSDGTRPQPDIMMQHEGKDDARVVLDVTAMSADGTVAVPVFRPSPEGRYLAYAIADGGSDWNVVRLLDTDSGETLPDVLTRTRYSSINWLDDSSAFYYGRYPERSGGDMKYMQIWLHKVGTPQTADTLIFETPEYPSYNFQHKVTEDGRYLVLQVWENLVGNRLWIRTLDEAGTLTRLWDSGDNEVGYLGMVDGRVYCQTNYGAPRGRIVYLTLDEPGVMHEVLPESDGVIDSYPTTLIDDKLFVCTLQDVTSRLNVYALDGTHVREIALPSLGAVSVASQEKQADKDLFIRFESFAHPPTIYHVDVTTGTLAAFNAPVLDFNPADIVVEQVFYTSKDGTRVPMFLVYQNGLHRDGTNPVYMMGYGGFGVSLTPMFGKQGAPWMAWLERGGVLAIPNLRGGGEYGETWHKAGMLDQKQNVFDDLHAAAEWLIANGYTQTARLGIEGGSNGGLLTSAAITQRPDLYGAAIVAVPLTDMLRYHHFTIGRLWIGEYGSADNPEQFPYIHAYSPLQNVKAGTAYPATLVTTGTHDDRVVPAHAYKFAASMQAAQVGPAPILLHVETRVGHGIGKPFSFILDAVASEYTFFAQQFGMEF